KIAYADKRLNLWYLDVEKGTPVKIDTTPYFNPTFQISGVWSPDSRWIAYARQLKSHMCAIFLYSLETGKSTQITDGLSDARFPAFDRSGKYLFFTASTDVGLTPGWLNMSSMGHPVTRSAYVVVLRKDLPSPLAPESDEEKADEKKPDAKKPDEKKSDEKKDGATAAAETPAEKDKEAERVRIDFDNIGQRILALPIPARNYTALVAGKAGIVFLAEGQPIGSLFGPGTQTLHRFDLSTRKVEKILDGINGFVLSA